MKIVLFIAPVVLYIIAIALATGKANFLIAGYNTASKEEKAKINGKALGKFMSLMFFVLGTIQLIIPICQIADVHNFKQILTWSNIAFVVVIIVGCIYMNVSKRFKNE